MSAARCRTRRSYAPAYLATQKRDLFLHKVAFLITCRVNGHQQASACTKQSFVVVYRDENCGSKGRPTRGIKECLRTTFLTHASSVFFLFISWRPDVISATEQMCFLRAFHFSPRSGGVGGLLGGVGGVRPPR